MGWIFLSLLTAVSSSVEDIIKKYSLTKNIDEYTIAWAQRLFALPVVVPLLFLFPIPKLENGFWIAFLAALIINSWVTILYVKAIKHSDISLVVPLVTFTPLFLLITSPLIVGEFPKPLGLIGVLVIVIGSYILSSSNGIKRSWLHPFRLLLKEKGARYMLLISFLWGITSNIDKVGLQKSSPIFWIASFFISSTILLFIAALVMRRRPIRTLLDHAKPLSSIGIVSGLTSVFQIFALQTAIVPYVISIKRTGTIFTVFAGHFAFHEQHFKKRFFGALLMVAGVILITLS